MADSDKNIRITTNKNKATLPPNIVFTGASAGTSVLTLEVRDDNTVAFTGIDGDVFSLDYNLSTGTIWSVNDKSGTPLLRASAGGTIGIAELGTGVIVGIGQTNPKYKLDVQGWVGFASTGDGSYTVLIENGLATGNNALSIRAANALRFYNSGNTLYTGFIGAQSGVNTTYTLPPRTPTGTATSYLSSGIDGVMAWVAAPTSGGSGSVSSGTATYAAYYPATSNSVSENANLQFTGTGVSIGGRINSTSITSGSIYIYGGIGITGNAFIGGTAYIPSTTASNISNLLVSNNTATTSTTSGALVVAGGLGLAGSAFIGGTAYIPSATASNISNLLVSNNTATTSTTSGALIVNGGLGLGGNAFIGSTVYVPSTTASNFANLLISNNTSSTSTSTGALVINGALGLGGNAFIGGTVTQQNNTSSTGTNSGALTVVGGVGIAGNAFIGGTFVHQSTASSVGTNSGSVTLAGGIGIAGNAFIGGTTTITSTTASVTSDSGALVIRGGVGIGQSVSIGGSLNIFNGANYTGFIFAGSANTTYTLPPRTPTGTATSYLSSGIDGVMAWVAAPTSGGSGSVSSGTATYAAYYPATSNSVSENANLQFTGTGVSIGGRINSTSTTSGSIYIYGGIGITGNAFIGGTAYIPSATASNISNLLVSNNTATTSTTSGALVVNGGLGLGGNAFIGSTVYVPSATPSNFSNLLVSNSSATTSTTSGALVVNGGLGLGGNAFIGSTVYVPSATPSNFSNLLVSNSTSSTSTSSGALVINGGLGIGGNAFIGGTFVQQNSTSSVGTNSGSMSIAGGMGLAGNAFIGGTTTITSTTASVASDSGALVIRGGVGIGQSVSIGGSLNIFNGANYSGFRFTGSASTTYTLPPRTPTGTGTSYLSSSIDGVMAWVAAPSGGGATPGGTNDGDIQYKSGSSFAAATTFNYDTNIGQLSVSSFPLSAVNSNSAALKLLGTSQGWTGSSLGAFLAINAATGFVGDLIHAQVNGVSRLQLSGDGYLRIGPTTGTGFTLPILNGSAGQVLTANANGVASWTTVSSSGAGSGTVAIPGAQYQVAAYYWSATGASVSGSSTFTNNTATGVARITHTTPSSSTSTGALVVDGSVGIGGSLYVGGQINQTYSPTSGAAVDHALFMQSNPVPTTVGALVQIGSANKWDGTTAGFFTGSFNGTYIGINAAAGNTADFINFQQNGVPYFVVGAGGSSIQLGQALDYSITNVLASFKSTVDSYNQIVVQNKSSGTNASANVIVNNNQSTDTIFYGEFGINSSNFSGTGALGAPNAVYLAATSGPLVLGTATQNPIRFVVNGSATDTIYIHEAGTAISVFTNLDLRAQNDIRFFNATNSNYAALQASNVTNNYTLSLPTAPVGAGASLIIVGSDSNMYFVAPGSGIAFSSATANTPIIRAKRALTLQFAAGYTPLAAGPDNVILKIPQATDGVSLTTFQLRELDIRVETPSAGSSRIQLEKYTGTTAFTLGGGVGISMVAGFGITLTGAGIYTTSTSFASGIFTTSNDKLRLNWTLLNATHANFTVQLTMEEV